MVIEAISFGQVIAACEVPDWWLDNPNLPHLTEEIDHRKEAAELELSRFQKKVEQFFNHWDQVRYELVFRSKMNDGK